MLFRSSTALTAAGHPSWVGSAGEQLAAAAAQPWMDGWRRRLTSDTASSKIRTYRALKPEWGQESYLTLWERASPAGLLGILSCNSPVSCLVCLLCTGGIQDACRRNTGRLQDACRISCTRQETILLHSLVCLLCTGGIQDAYRISCTRQETGDTLVHKLTGCLQDAHRISFITQEIGDHS